MAETETERLAGPLSIVQVLFAPGEVFASLARAPSYWAAFLSLWLATIAVSAVVTQRIDWESFKKKQIEQIEERMGNVPEERRQEAIQGVEKFYRFIPILGVAQAVITAPLLYLLLTTVFWVLLRVGTGSEIGWKGTFSATLHGLAPVVPSALVLTAVVLGRGGLIPIEEFDDVVMSHLGAFVTKEAAGDFVHALCQSVDIFSIWSLVLLTIGYSAVGKVSRGKAGTVVVSSWAVYALVRAALKVAFASFGG